MELFADTPITTVANGMTIEGSAYFIIHQAFEPSETIVIRLAVTRENIYRHLDAMKSKPSW